ncbi:MAG: hypothetical protein CV082_01625 [Candidatus Brocadia sp. BL1]|nr:MAG: hypothetical protein CV082_01625 [Candidatus Brocadia sp. BL1]
MWSNFLEAFFLALLTAFIWGFVPFLEKIGLSSVEPTAAYLVRCSGIFLGIGILIAFTPQFPSFAKMGIKSVFFLVLAGMLAGVVAQLVFYKALKTGEISRIIPVTSCYPLFSFLLGWIFLGEEITVSKIAGMLLILGGILLLK